MQFKVIQGHRGRYQLKARMRIPISELTSYRVPFGSYRSLLFEFLTLCVLSPLSGS